MDWTGWMKKKDFKIERESIKEAIEALEDATNVDSSHDSEIDEGENFDEFSLSDIPEIPSALEKHTQRSITPYPMSSTSSSSSSSRPSTVNVKPNMLTSGIPSATNAIIPMGDITNQNSKPLHTLRKKFVGFENMGGDATDTGQMKQRVVEVSWCSFYLIGRIFGLFLVLTGLILIIMVALNDNNPSNSDSTNSIAISDDNSNMHTTIKTTTTTTTTILTTIATTTFIPFQSSGIIDRTIVRIRRLGVNRGVKIYWITGLSKNLNF